MKGGGQQPPNKTKQTKKEEEQPKKKKKNQINEQTAKKVNTISIHSVFSAVYKWLGSP